MIAAQIEAALASRYSGRGWANFFQYRPMTSYEASLSSIDLLAEIDKMKSLIDEKKWVKK